jgi:DNA processing protein
LEQNRDVFVVPGPVKHPNFQGSHELIKAGAALVTNPSDILDALRLTERAAAQPLFDNEEERAIVTTLKASARPLTVDDIAERTALDAQHINKTISFLLMKNAVQETDNGYSV